MGLILAKPELVLSDDWTERATIELGGFDRIDCQAYDGAALLQIHTPQGAWEPEGGLIVRRGLFRSLTGLLAAYGPTGPRGVRLRRAYAGIPATIDLELWGID